jgi:histidyl-tRNA synthetase
MARLQPVRGTHDIMPEEMRRHRRVCDGARAIASRYGYAEMATPIFEFTDVFARTIGEATDIVSKEMYTFTDRGGESLTLRPENTAGVARALISGGLRQNLPLKYFYAGPMFRYERPQKGRLRQFHQIGIELLGVPEPQGDVEVIAVGQHILESLGLGAVIALEINTLGDSESRTAYREVLVRYLREHAAKLSEDSRTRLERNPMRILDSKDQGDREIVAAAPPFGDYLTPAAQEFFAIVRGGLDELGIAYTINPRLVRGLDYYCHTAFEFTTTELGAQGTVMGGGRYDGLLATMGEDNVPGVGWAAGVERLAMLVSDSGLEIRPLAIVPVGAASEPDARRLAARLRRSGFAVDIAFAGNLKKRMQRANRAHARAALLIGEAEQARGVVALRDLDSGAQSEVAIADLESRLEAYR